MWLGLLRFPQPLLLLRVQSAAAAWMCTRPRAHHLCADGCLQTHRKLTAACTLAANHDEATHALKQSAAEREAELTARISELERFVEGKGFDAVRLQAVEGSGDAEGVETAVQSQAALDEVAALANKLQAQQARSEALVQRLQVVLA